MSLAAQYHAEHKARLTRLGASAPKPAAKIASRNTGRKPKPVNAEIFYPQMWMWDLVSPGGEPKRARMFRFAAVVDAACKYFLIPKDEILSPRMTADVVYPRQICYWLAWRFTNASSMRLGQYFDRDHATILHGQKKIRRLIREDWRVAYDIAHLEAML